MQAKLTVKNYRAFVRPTSLELHKGFSAFVGVNNAGKSALMRCLLEFRHLFESIQPGHGSFHQSLEANSSNITNLIHVADNEEVFSNLNDKGIQFDLEFAANDGDSLAQNAVPVTKATVLLDRNLRSHIDLYSGSERLPTEKGFKFLSPNVIYAEKTRLDLSALFETTNLLARSLYVGPFRNTINVGTKTDYLDIQIGEAFIHQFENLKTGPSKKSNTAVSEIIEHIRRIFEFRSLDISSSSDKTSLHITINGKPYKQHELGSGLTQFIIVLANVATKRPRLLLIDEPELNLHPSLQIDFLTTLGAYASDATWFSTHSLGLARSIADRIYSVTKISDGDSVVRQLAGIPRPAEFLGELSFSSHKELGFDKILLVEGPTEVKTIQTFLRLLGKDHKIMLLPLHGHMLGADELEEIMRITTNIYALIDSEKTSENDSISPSRQSFLELLNNRGLKAHVLRFRAMENYFPTEVVKTVFGNNYRALSPYEKLGDVTPHWGKSQNWKLASAMSREQLLTTDLGSFLAAI